MKKILAVLLAGMMAVTAFAGCGGGQKTESSGSGSESGDSTKVEVKEGAIVDESVFGDENNITLKVWAPDKAVKLVQQQVEEFKKAYPNKTFTKIEVVAQGEGDAGTQLLNDASVAADVFGNFKVELVADNQRRRALFNRRLRVIVAVGGVTL